MPQPQRTDQVLDHSAGSYFEASSPELWLSKDSCTLQFVEDWIVERTERHIVASLVAVAAGTARFLAQAVPIASLN